MNDPLPLPSRALRAYATLAKTALWLLLALWLALVLAWGALHGWIVPRIGELRPELEMEAARVLGVPVRISEIEARSEGLIPSFELRGVVLLDPQGREALRLPRVLAALSPRSLWNLGFEQLFIDAPELDIRRAADGRIFVAGLDFSRPGDNEGRAADWFFRQGEFALRGGTIRWTDEMRGAPPLELSDVDLVVRNKARRHSMKIEATPPAEWGERFSLSGQFRQPLLSGRDGRWQEWAGQLYAEFSRVDLAQLRRHADFGVRIATGTGALRAWADVEKARVVGGTADVRLAGVDATLGEKLEPLVLASVSGRLGGRRLDNGFEFRTEGLQFETVEGQRWPGGNVYVSWTGPAGDIPAQGELRADKLDLAALSQIATRLPLSRATHEALGAYDPKGLVETVQAKWAGPLDAPQKYEARGRASGLEVASRPHAAASDAKPRAGTPGLRGAQVEFNVTQGGGTAKVAMQQGALDFPGVFEEPRVPVDSLTAEVQWQAAAGRISVDVNNLRFANADAQGAGQVRWRTSDTAGGASRYPGVLDLQASLDRADGTRVWRYLPLGVGKNARDYVRDSVQQGTATGAKFRVRGDLRQFPWPDGKQGEFLVTAHVQDALYAYVPRSMNKAPASWPALAQLSGELVFEGNGMRVKNAVGRFAGAPGLQVKAEAEIPDFHATTVDVKGQFKGPLGESLAIVNGSPVAGLMNNAFAKSRATGTAEVKLALQLPAAKIENSRVQGTVTLSNTELQVTPDTPVLRGAKGTVVFNEKGFGIVGGQARALGGDVRIEGGTRIGAGPLEPSIVLRAQGVATAAGLREATELGFVSKLARDATGSAPYNLVLGFRHGTPEILVTSTLQGLGVPLPPPLNKPADSALPLRYETVVSRDPATPAKLQDRVSVDLGRVLSLVYQRDISEAEPRVLRGAVFMTGESAKLPESGVAANVVLGSIDLDAWDDALERVFANGSASAATRPPAETQGPGYLPTQLTARAKELRMEGRALHDVVLGGSREGLTWRANVEAQELAGYVEFRQPSGAGAGRLHARLSRMAIGASDAKEVEALLDQQPASIPALDIVVDDFELKGRKLGKLEIDAINRGSGVVSREGGIREWRLNRLALSSPEATFTATGNWAAIGAQAVPAGGSRPAPAPANERRRTVMNFKLDIADAGATLGRFGMKDVVRRGRGRMEGQVAWVGSPISLDYPSLQGNFNVNVEAGQFLKADPGIAKLLGVLSLQSLPRRLALDFRDVFTEGFSFDFVRGDVTIERGVASTNNLQMKGVNAAVLMEGKADIARETQDLKVVVVPEINAGTASLVATVINPAIGLGSFLAQMFLRQPLIRAATQEFHIDGTWADPRVTKVQRSSTTGQSALTEGREEATR